MIWPRRRAISGGESGSTYRAASPQTSGTAVADEASTGQSQLIASSGGRPKPSYDEAKTSAIAAP